MRRLALALAALVATTLPAEAIWHCRPWLLPVKFLKEEVGVTVLDTGMSRDLQDYLMKGEAVPFVITGAFFRFQRGWTVIAWLGEGQVCTNHTGYPAESYWTWREKRFGLEA